MNDGLVDVTLAGLTKQVMLSRKLPRLFLQTRWLFVPNRLGELGNFLFSSVFANAPRYFMLQSEVRTSSRSARSCAFLRQRLVVKLARGPDRAEIELIFPTKFETRLLMALSRYCAPDGLWPNRRRGRRFVGDDPSLTSFLFGNPRCFRCDVSKHGAPHNRSCRADRAGDVIVARRDVGGERPESVEWRFVTPLELFIHVLLDHVHRDMTGAFVHHLHVLRPCALG